jgi:hypothetical protein
VNELIGVHRFLYQRLACDPELAGLVGKRIYERGAPQGAAYPLVLFKVQAATDLLGAGAARLWMDALVQVKAVGPGAASELSPIADRLDALLHVAEPVVVSQGEKSYQIHGSHRERTINYDEVVAGQVYLHLGGLYRVFCTAIGG